MDCFLFPYGASRGGFISSNFKGVLGGFLSLFCRCGATQLCSCALFNTPQTSNKGPRPCFSETLTQRVSEEEGGTNSKFEEIPTRCYAKYDNRR